jgi:hypothetical protein
MAEVATLEKEEEIVTTVVAEQEFDLDPELESEIEASVLAANAGKAKDQLENEIKTAKEAKKNELIEANKPILAKATELKALAENKDKTDDELYELAQAELDKVNPPKTDDETPKLGDDFFGVANPKSTDKETPAAETEFNVPEAFKPQWERAKKITEDPVADIYFKAKEAGQVQDFLGLLDTLPPDPDKMSPEMLKEMEIRFYDKNITPEDLEEVLEEFKEKKNFEKMKDVSSFAALLRQDRQNGLKMLEGSVTSKATATKESIVKATQEAESELNGTYKGKLFFGVPVTDEVVNKVMNSIRQNGISFKRADGSPDVSKAIQSALVESYLPDMLQEAFNRGVRTASKKEAIKRGKPLTGLKARTGIVKSPTVSRQEALKKVWEEKNGVKK